MIQRLLLIGVLFIGGCLLPPLPNVAPVPPAPVVKQVDSLWFITVDDVMARVDASGNLTSSAAVITDTAYWSGLRARGHHFNSVDVNTEDAKNYVKQTSVTGIPSLIVADATQTPPLPVLTAVKLPDKAGIDALVKTYSGK